MITLDPNNIPQNRPTHSSGRCHGSRVDSIDYYTDKIQNLERQIHEARDRAANKPHNYGFISFHNISDAHVVAKQYGGFNLERLAVSRLMLAPWPKDIIWNNLPSVGAVKGTKKLIGYGLFIVLCFFWLVPVTLLSMSTQLINIARMAPDVAKFMEHHWIMIALIESWMTPLLMSIFFVILPFILRKLSQFQGKLSKSSLERSLLAKLYLFFFINNIILYTASTTIYDIFTKIKAIINRGDPRIQDIFDVFEDSDLFEQTAKSIIRVSTFWINYISLRGAGTLIELAQIAGLVIKKIRRFFVTETPRNMKEFARPPNFDYAIHYNFHLFFFTVGMMYSVIAPAILFFCFLYFGLAYVTYRYQLMYIFTTKIETGGALWRVVFNRMIVSVIFWQFVMIGVMNLKSMHFHSLAVIPLPVISILLKILCGHSFDEKIRYYTSDSSSEKEKQTEDLYHERDKVSTRFGHPALSTELIKPMLNSNVKMLLDKIYDGRVEEVKEEKRRRPMSSMVITNGENVIKFETVNNADLEINDEYMEESAPEYYDGYENPSPSHVQEQKVYSQQPLLQYHQDERASPSSSPSLSQNQRQLSF